MRGAKTETIASKYNHSVQNGHITFYFESDMTIYCFF